MRGCPHLLSLVLISLLTVFLMEFCPLFEGLFLWAANGMKMKPDKRLTPQVGGSRTRFLLCREPDLLLQYLPPTLLYLLELTL